MPKIEMLGQIDGPIEGYVTVLARIHVEAGEQVGRHTHPGVESTYFLEGEGVVMADGFPDKPCKAGDWFQVPPGVPHSVRIGPGFVSAQRFKLTDAQRAKPPHPFRYLALYEIETNDLQKTLDELGKRSGTPAMVLTDTMAPGTQAHIYEAITPVVTPKH